MTKEDMRYIGHDMDDILDKAHEMSMASDPAAASFGRILKNVTPAFVDWLEGEKQRKVDPTGVLSASTQWIASMVVTMVVNMSGNREAGQELMEFLLERLSHHVRNKFDDFSASGAYEERQTN